MEMQKTQSRISINETQGTSRRVDVAVCGGGIGGLAIAAFLMGEGSDVVVLEKTDRPGGAIGSIRRDDFLFERGPNTLLEKYASFDRLVHWAGLERDVIRRPMRDQQRHIWLNGRLQRAPTGPLAFLTTGLLPISAKLAMLREPFVRRGPEDESVADFVARRLGRPWVRNLITPMVSGIWAGNPELLSIPHAFPIMKQFEREGGSILRGAFKHLSRLRREGRQENRPRLVKSLVSFSEGLDQFPRAIAARLGERFHASTRIERIEPLGAQNGFRIVAEHNGESQTWLARRIVVAADAEAAAGWFTDADNELASVLRGFPYNRLVVAGLGIDASAARLPEGFGFLAVRDEGIRILGAIVNSNFLPGRAPSGCAALTIFIGGDLDPAAVDLDGDELMGLLSRDLRRAIGWDGSIRGLHLERWSRAIPQYDLRHGERLRQLDAAEARWPGLMLAGNWRGGVSIGDRIEYAAGLTKRILQTSHSVKD